MCQDTRKSRKFPVVVGSLITSALVAAAIGGRHHPAVLSRIDGCRGPPAVLPQPGEHGVLHACPLSGTPDDRDTTVEAPVASCSHASVIQTFVTPKPRVGMVSPSLKAFCCSASRGTGLWSTTPPSTMRLWTLRRSYAPCAGKSARLHMTLQCSRGVHHILADGDLTAHPEHGVQHRVVICLAS